MKHVSAYMTLVAALVFSGCASTPTSRGTGQVIDDAAITARVKTEIAKTAGLADAAAINVDTYRGVVSLAGFVDNADEVRTAISAARTVEGVSQVKNNLEIKSRR